MSIEMDRRTFPISVAASPAVTGTSAAEADAAPHAQYYNYTVIPQTKTPDHGNLDIVEKVTPVGKKRGVETYACSEDVWSPAVKNIEKTQERDLYGRPARTVCVSNPDHHNFLITPPEMLLMIREGVTHRGHPGGRKPRGLCGFVYNGLIGLYKEFIFADYARAIRGIGPAHAIPFSDLGRVSGENPAKLLDLN